MALSQMNGQLTRLPGRDWEHRVIEIQKTDATPLRFPRKAGIAEKRLLK